MTELPVFSDEPVKNFARGENYVVGFSFKEALIQTLIDFALTSMENGSGIPHDHRLINAARTRSLDFDQIKRYIEVRGICGVTLIIKPGEPRLGADIDLL